jgi:hypothetical protein
VGDAGGRRCWRAPRRSRLLAFNPTLDEAKIVCAFEDDGASAKSEFGAEFRSDLSSLLADDVIDQAIDHARPLELPPQGDVYYKAFVDASAGRHDAFTMCIGHVEGEDDSKVFVCDVLRASDPPFQPNNVAKEYAALAKQYGIPELVGDSYAGEWVRQAFLDAGVSYRKADLPKSQLYLESLSTFNRGNVRLPDDAKLIRGPQRGGDFYEHLTRWSQTHSTF